MPKILSSLFSLFLLGFVFINLSLANAQNLPAKQVVIVNPIRGSDFWEYDHNLLDTPKKQYEVIGKNNLSATWLVRFDALAQKEVVDFLKNLDSRQEVGLLLEVTPAFTQAANVKYNESPNWHFPQSVFLTGYSPDDRKKLIDAAVLEYRKIFNQNPKSVGAWWIDAFSLNYLRDKYQIEANLDVADQYSTDDYQVWGQYFSVPFYPSKLNALHPAQSKEQKIGVVTMQWASRDPFNGYGNGVFDSTYSVQANDYMLHDLGIDYFEKLLNIYPQITLGLENDFSWNEFGEEYQKQIELITQKQRANLLSVKNMSEFASFYQRLYPEISPEVLISADDPLGSGGKVVWYQTPKYRVGWFYNNFGSVIRDLRLYNDSVKENCYDIACQQLNLAITPTKALDDVTFGERWVIDEDKISDFF